MNLNSEKLKKGFPKPDQDHHDLIRKLTKPNLVISVLWAVSYHLSILVMASGVAAAFNFHPLLAALAYPIAVLYIASRQRGLENMVHDASHKNWSTKKYSRLAILLADILAAWPSFMSVNDFWKKHLLHHKEFGSQYDPCRLRAENFEAAKQRGYIKTLRKSTQEFYADVLNAKNVTIAVAWHSVVYGIPLCFAFGWQAALALWVALWLVPQFFVLPVIRFIAEAEEHDYSCMTESAATFSNVGFIQRNLFHPAGDAYHQIHHWLMGVPMWKQAKAHQQLKKFFPDYKNSKFRHSIVSKVRKERKNES